MSGPFFPFSQKTEKLVENGDFSQINQLGLPFDWDYRADSADWISIKKEGNANYLELNTPSVYVIYMIQHLAEFKPGKNYLIRWKVRGDSSARYRVYIEWHDKNKKSGDPGFLKSVNGNSWTKPGNEWTTMEFKFTSFGEEYVNPYFVLNAKGPGRIGFSDVDIIQID